MASELERLAEAASQLASVAGARNPGVAERAATLGERFREGRFHVSVLGEFKRGKSTFVNALVGEEVLPTGVVPVTAVTTEVRYGEPAALVVFGDGREQRISPDRLWDFVTEAGNPANERNVARVVVWVPAPLLAPGVVLVDTPGLGSIFGHDETARRALFDANGAILVLAADAPLSENERQLLAILSERRAPTFIVLNKIDHLTIDERAEVRRFVTRAVADEIGRQEPLYCVAARPALEARRDGREPGEEAGDFGRFADAFGRFVATDLVETRIETGRRELATLARRLDTTVTLEASALAMSAETLARRVREFRAQAQEQRQLFEDERTLLGRDVAAVHQRLAAVLADFARRAPARGSDQLAEVSRTVPVQRLEDELRATVEAIVHEEFEAFRQEQADATERRWRELAEGFRIRTQARVDAVRAAAADLFDVALPHTDVPAVAEERERFFYLFLHVERPGEAFSRLTRLFLPRSVVRKRLLARAARHLASEFDKHAGRARWDLSQRLEQVRRRFELAMKEELDSAIETILRAAARAEELRGETEMEQVRRAAEDASAREVAARVLELVGG